MMMRFGFMSLLFFSMMWSRPARATIAFVQGTTEYKASSFVASGSVTFSAAPKSGNTVIVYVAGYNSSGGPILSASDNQGNTYSVAAHLENGLFSVAILYASNINYTSGSFTVTAAAAGTGYLTFSAVEYSGLAKSNVLDQYTCNTAASTSPFTGTTGTTVQDSELLAAVFDDLTFSNDSIGIPSGFTSRWLENDANYNTGAAADRIVSSRGTYSATFTSNQSNGYYACIATFRAAPSPGGFQILQ